MRGRMAGAEAKIDELSTRFQIAVNAAEIAAIPAQLRNDGDTVLNQETGTLYRFSAASTHSGQSVITPSAGSGRWIRVNDEQAGRATLVAGAATVTGVRLTSTSRITVQMVDPGAGDLATFIGFSTPEASRNVGAGSFVIHAIDNAKAVLATAVPTVDWTITDVGH